MLSSDLVLVKHQFMHDLYERGYAPDVDAELREELDRWSRYKIPQALEDVSSLESELVKDGHPPTLRMIEPKIITTPIFEYWHEVTSRQYYKAKSQYRFQIQLSSNISEHSLYLYLDLDPTTTVRELLERFRFSSGLTEDAQLRFGHSLQYCQLDHVLLECTQLRISHHDGIPLAFEQVFVTYPSSQTRV